MSTIQSHIESQLTDLIAIRHDLHANPELGYEEHRTSEVVQRELTAAGIEFKAGLAGGTGVLAHLPGGDGDPIGLRADMDALPILEQTGLPYASTTEGRMHACGHDGHTTILIGVARVLASMAKNGGLPRPVSLLFQPAEEGGAGGK
ncbi:MAG: M20/M25/M40 family metallo-hydrolase, partial [Phycisphaerae bacterium]|nr:M20/M25/M40 family metallo-hydrolase [Phycisphaerae bacterium]